MMHTRHRHAAVVVNTHCIMGFTYIAVLVAIAIMGTVLGATMEVWHTAMQREKERELLFIGNQFRQALGSYYHAGNSYPLKLEDLLKDPRQPQLRRHLRKIYHDPMTGKAEWGLLLGAHGEITGVHSLSEQRPIKTSGFSDSDVDFSAAKKYSEWTFSYQIQPASATAGSRLQANSVQGLKLK